MEVKELDKTHPHDIQIKVHNGFEEEEISMSRTDFKKLVQKMQRHLFKTGATTL